MPKPHNARVFIDPPTRSDGKNGEKILRKKGLEIVKRDQLKYLAYFKTLGEGLTEQEGTALACLPAGYALGKKRDHKVLTGHPSGRDFASSTMFLPHLKWLFTSGEDPCQCKLCNGRKKRPRQESNKIPEHEGEEQQQQQQSMKEQQQQQQQQQRPSLIMKEEHENQKRLRQRLQRRRRHQLKDDGIYGPLRPMDKVLIKMPHENDLPIPGCISIPTLVPVPNIEEKLRPQQRHS
ncbi:hypothetical protein O0I10_000828 [Lichtheimia ornata]|uniref:Cryptic loci regulator 2 N-terminal domain-containing protein n=1 Tax=Lichtheimia ornata TaxID=688661 RepID=A0AAD7Y4D8_9FUNG|nr:uncharacterized protein O0I10_000828 [Lichtheimia ornata]KAJ8663583.1 hypothetical protein O0I10_000828 [Lichtheimia ornata]